MERREVVLDEDAEGIEVAEAEVEEVAVEEEEDVVRKATRKIGFL